MKELKVEDMIGYKAPAEKMKTHIIDKLIGVKTAKFDGLPPINSGGSQMEDFKLKMDKHVNDVPYDMHKLPRNTDSAIVDKATREERAYSIVESFVPGYRKAGKWYDKAGAAIGIKSSKRRLKDSKRRHVINHVANTAGELVKNQRPDIDPNVVDLGTGIAGMVANKATDKGVNKYRGWREKVKAKKEAKRKLIEGN